MVTTSRTLRQSLEHSGTTDGLTAGLTLLCRYFDIDITNYVFAPPTTNTLVIQVTQPNDACFPPNNNSTVCVHAPCLIDADSIRISHLLSWIGLITLPITAWSAFLVTSLSESRHQGIWRDVIVSMVDGITVRYPAVTSTLAPVRNRH